MPHAGVVSFKRLGGGLLVSEDTVTLPTWSAVSVLADQNPLLSHWQFLGKQILSSSTGTKVISTFKESNNLGRSRLKRKSPHLDYIIRFWLLLVSSVLEVF